VISTFCASIRSRRRHDKGREGYSPEGYTLYTYAAIRVFAEANKVDDLSKALKSTPVDKVVGPLSWDKKGDVTDPKYVFYIWKGGKYAEM
jgi:branched-chain amino acid transport system substrate-binding protein